MNNHQNHLVRIIFACCLLFVFGNGVGRAAVQNLPDSSGGPDEYGYRFIDSNDPGGPVYSWQEISTTGTMVHLEYDEIDGPFPIGFPFFFYGDFYDVIGISSHGWISLIYTQNSSICDGSPIPNSDDPNGIISAWWECLDPEYEYAGSGIYYQTLGTAPNRVFIVEFKNYHHDEDETPDLTNFQIKLFEADSSIEVHYQSAPTDGEPHTAGIENPTGEIGLQYYFGGAALATPLAVRYYLPQDVYLSSSEPLTKIGGLGAAVTFPLTVTNLTGASDSFDLSVSGNSYPTTLSVDNTGTLADGESFDFSVEVQIPASASVGDIEIMSILAASAASPAVYNSSVDLKVTVELLRIRAEIDGRSLLIIQSDCLHWRHLEYAAPGRETGNINPTYINGEPWYPVWPDIPDDRNDNCSCDSSSFGPIVGLKPVVQTAVLERIEFRDYVEILEQPSSANGYSLVIEFDDDPGGSSWYEIRLSYETFEPEHIYLPVIRK